MSVGAILVVFSFSIVLWIIGAVIGSKIGDASPQRRTSMIVSLIVVLVAALALTIIWIVGALPWFQPMIFHMFYTNSGLWLVWLIILIGAGIIGGLVALLTKDTDSDAWKWTFGILFAVGFIGYWITYGILGGAWTEQKIYQSLQYQEIQNLPDTTAVRYLPMEVAWRYGENRLQEPRVRHVDADPIVVGSEVQWELTRAPKGFWNECLNNSDGFSIIDSKGDMTTIRQEMKYGEGMLGADNILWKLRQQDYWMDVTEVFYIQGKDGEVIAMAPYLKNAFRFPVTVPYWGGVFLARSNGTIENLTPQQAQNNPLLKGVRLFPEKLARLYAGAYAYKDGIGNAMFRHVDQIQIPSVGTGTSAAYGGNEMPFLLPTESGQKWFVAAVPWGAQGIYRIFLIDAITGKIEMFSLPQDSSLIGPDRARGYITRVYPTFDWTQILVLEPRPIMEKGTLYWMFTLTPNNFAGIVDTVLVNSRTNEVISLGSDYQQTLRFVRGEKVGNVIGIGGSMTAPPALQITPSVPSVPQQLTPQRIQQIIDELNQISSV